MDKKSNISYGLTTSMIVGSGHEFRNIINVNSLDDCITMIKEFARICNSDSIEFHLTIEKNLPFEFLIDDDTK